MDSRESQENLNASGSHFSLIHSVIRLEFIPLIRYPFMSWIINCWLLFDVAQAGEFGLKKAIGTWFSVVWCEAIFFFFRERERCNFYHIITDTNLLLSKDFYGLGLIIYTIIKAQLIFVVVLISLFSCTTLEFLQMCVLGENFIKNFFVTYKNQYDRYINTLVNKYWKIR